MLTFALSRDLGFPLPGIALLTVLLRHQLRILGLAQPHAHIADGQAVLLRLILASSRARPASSWNSGISEAVMQQVAAAGAQIGQHGRRWGMGNRGLAKLKLKIGPSCRKVLFFSVFLFVG